MFACVPPTSYVLQPPPASLYSSDKVNGTPRAPLRVPASSDAILGAASASCSASARNGSQDSTASPLYLSESSDNEGGSSSDDQRNVWYAIYEGRAKEVTVCNLTPGQTLQFRVRASSHRSGVGINIKSQQITSNDLTTAVLSWGPALHSPLKVVTPAVPPINPPSNLRLYGRPRPTKICLTWDPPASNGGAPILSYELWQSLCDPISGSPIKTIPQNPSARCRVAPESLQDICKEVVAEASSAIAVASAPTSVTASPVHHRRRLPKPDDSQLLYAGLDPAYEVTNLEAGRTFAFRVRARNSTGWSDWSDWSRFSTAQLPPEEPTTPPVVKALSPTSVAVSWAPLRETNGAEVTDYRVEWQSNSTEGPSPPYSGASEEDQSALTANEHQHTKPGVVCRSRNPSVTSSAVGVTVGGACGNNLPKGVGDGFQLVSTFLTLPATI